MQRMPCLASAVGVTWAVCLLGGCNPHPALTQLPQPTVTVCKPIQKPVTDFVDFTGRTDAVFSTDIRPRVTGYLVGMPFQEGKHVAKDEVLFAIDPQPYQLALDSAVAVEAASKAALVKTQADYDMDLELQKTPGAISQQEVIKALAARDEAKANLDHAKAALASAQLNLGWCQVRSPIEGTAGRYLLTVGNLVNADSTLLTTVVSDEPMYVYFDADENTMLEAMRKILLPSKVDLLSQKGGVPVSMGLGDEAGFPHLGHIDYGSNVVNASTGTITVRGVFDNPASPGGKRLLRPGMFVRVRLPLGQPHDALLVCEKALESDQGQKYLLLVNDKGIVEYRPVQTGALQEDGLRVIVEGLRPGERVIVDGLQNVRPEMQVNVDEKPMPGAVAAQSPSRSAANN